MKGCTLKLGNKTKGLEFTYTMSNMGYYEFTFKLFLKNKSVDYALHSRYLDDQKFIANLKIFDGNFISYNFSGEVLLDIEITNQHINIYTAEWEDETEYDFDVEYPLNEKDLKKLQKFIKQMNEVDNEIDN
jgi:hypothetical protein